MKVLQLKPGREKSLLRHHYWVFSGAVKRPPEGAAAGETVKVISDGGEFLAYAAWSPASQICARVWSFDPAEERVDVGFFRRRLEAALELRRVSGIAAACTGYRLVASEGDDLPGVVTDLYGDTAVVQFLSAGAELCRRAFVEALRGVLPRLERVYERSDAGVRRKEALKLRTGAVVGEAPTSPVEFSEHGMRLLADVVSGHKTGFYFDQRENRRLAKSLAAGRRVLNLFSYTGGFGVAAAIGGAEFVENVDSSQPALLLAGRNMELNGVPEDRWTNTCANVFELLRARAAAGGKYDMIVLDPPKLVEAQSNLTKGCRAYKELALRAFKLLEPNGILLTFSCSGLVDTELFSKITFEACADAGCHGTVLRRLSQDADHPVRLNHPETSYLKGLLVVKSPLEKLPFRC